MTDPCNSTEKDPGKKKCLVDFKCMGTVTNCQYHIKKVNHQSHTFIDDRTVKPITTTTEAIHVPQGNITVDEKPHHTMNEELTASTYDVNLIYINDSVMQESSKSRGENCTVVCDHAESVCIGGEKSENDSLSDIKNIHTLEIEINRDETSPVQPLFTGHFPESSKNKTKNYKNHFKYLITGSLSCSSLKYKNCKNNSSKQFNVYIKANCIENDTITKYPNCTKNLITAENVKNHVYLKCEDISFAKHNLRIVQTLPTSSPKLTTWNCQITEFNTPSSKEQRIENNKIHFYNCSNKTKIISNKNKYKDINITPILDNKTINIDNFSTKNHIELEKTDISIGKGKKSKDLSSQANPENIITILITEQPNNCSDISNFNINEGKFIYLGTNNNTEKIVQNNHVEIILSNCINVSSSTVNETQPPSKVDLNIILINESLSTSNLKHFNGTPKDLTVKRGILLTCDHTNIDLDNNKTVLNCKSIDLNLYNITGIEMTPLNQTSDDTTAIASKTKQEVSSWNCQIFESNDTLSSKEQHSEKGKLYFKNCANEVNSNGNNSVTPISDIKNRTFDSFINSSERIDSIKRNEMEIPSGKLVLNTDILPRVSSENMIKIIVTEKADNCSNNISLNIDGGKIIDLGTNNNEKKFLQNNILELKLFSCINMNSSINNETQPNPKVDLTIILKNESSSDAILKQFNGTVKLGSMKQRLLLQCDYPKFRSNTTVLHCESIDLQSHNITGIETTTNANQTSKLNQNNTKEKKKNNNIKMIQENHNKTKVNENNNFSTKTPVDKNEDTINKDSNENNTKVFRIKEVQKKEEKSNKLIFNRKKDIPDDVGHNVLALANPETERISLIVLLTVTCIAIVIVIALRACPKRREYSK